MAANLDLSIKPEKAAPSEKWQFNFCIAPSPVIKTAREGEPSAFVSQEKKASLSPLCHAGTRMGRENPSRHNNRQLSTTNRLLLQS
jgi:hypothetical protein